MIDAIIRNAASLSLRRNDHRMDGEDIARGLVDIHLYQWAFGEGNLEQYPETLVVKSAPVPVT